MTVSALSLSNKYIDNVERAWRLHFQKSIHLQVQMVSSSHHETDKGTKHFSTLRKQQITIINIRVQFHRSLRFVELVSWCSGRLGARSFLHVMCSGYAKSSQILKASALAFCPGQPL
ncbi:unnamed protein product [Knipowitschia caucasica]